MIIYFVPETTAMPHTFALMCTVLGILTLVMLSSCGGGGEEATTAPAKIQTNAESAETGIVNNARQFKLATDADPTSYSDADARRLFDWAQWKYPSLFFNGQPNVLLDYEGHMYYVRAYSNGNYLGLRLNGEIFGLGPFTNNLLTQLGSYTDFSQQLQSDACMVGRVYCNLPTISVQPSNVTGQ